MCLAPKWIYKKGNYKQDNYRGKAGAPYELGCYAKCSSCVQCIAEKSNNWVIRNTYEAKQHEKICFITLTYAESPIILIKKDMQDFIKRLRSKLWREQHVKVRTYNCGEYGTVGRRPHFHIMIYGWEDPNAKYLGINKKKNIILQSPLIQETWGLGRTSYQTFDNHEIPYISLYNTPEENFKNAYKINAAKLKKLKDLAKSWSIRFNEDRAKNLRSEIQKIEKEMEEEKKKWKTVKEFNTWSIGLGWEKFCAEYCTQENYTFEEYIDGCRYVTPSPWVKKLANMGDEKAINEMFRRELENRVEPTEESEKIKNEIKVAMKKKKEILEWAEEKSKM